MPPYSFNIFKIKSFLKSLFESTFVLLILIFSKTNLSSSLFLIIFHNLPDEIGK